jgi:hypothetical protein
VKALSVRPPFAQLIAAGVKTLELRSRPTSHRGELLICATKPEGRALAVATVTGCRPFTPADERAAQSDFEPGLWAWELADARRIQPFAVKGKLGLFNVPDHLIHIAARARGPTDTPLFQGDVMATATKKTTKSPTKKTDTVPVFAKVGMKAQGFNEPGVLSAITAEHAIITPDNGSAAEAVPWKDVALMGVLPDPTELAK